MPVLLAALGGLWVAGGVAVVALVPAGANGIGFAWVAWGVAHLVAALGLRSGSAAALVLAAVLGLVGLIAATSVIVFIVAMNLSEGRGIDLGATWFAPLNGVATALVYAVLAVANVAMIATAVQTIVVRGRRA
jgi:hypothetical protein